MAIASIVVDTSHESLHIFDGNPDGYEVFCDCLAEQGSPFTTLKIDTLNELFAVFNVYQGWSVYYA